MPDLNLPPINGHTALLIVDVQNGFISDLTAHIPDAVNQIRPKYNHVIATRFFNAPQSPHRNLLNWHRFEQDSDEYRLAITAEENDLVYDKSGYSALTKDLKAYLKQHSIDTIHIAGIDTNACILSTATDLFESNQYRPIVLAKYCASHSGREYHDMALKMIEKLCGTEQLWLN